MSPPIPYRSTIRHVRIEGVDRRFSYRHVLWLVDLDDVPTLSNGRLRRALLPHFAARDHFGDPGASLRSNVEQYLTERGIDLDGGKVLMLANPRSFGYAFNPLTVYWCYRRDETLACVIAEVQNTYGGRHCYLVLPDADGHSQADKEFYVSPFLAVDGSYDMRFGEPGEELDIAITLRRGSPSEAVFRASLRGTRLPQPRSFLAAALRRPGSSWRVIALIRWQGLRIWARRVPIVPRPVSAAGPVPSSAQPSVEP